MAISIATTNVPQWRNWHGQGGRSVASTRSPRSRNPRPGHMAWRRRFPSLRPGRRNPRDLRQNPRRSQPSASRPSLQHWWTSFDQAAAPIRHKSGAEVDDGRRPLSSISTQTLILVKADRKMSGVECRPQLAKRTQKTSSSAAYLAFRKPRSIQWGSRPRSCGQRTYP